MQNQNVTSRFYALYPLLKVFVALVVGLLLGQAFPILSFWLLMMVMALCSTLFLSKYPFLQAFGVLTTFLCLGGFLMSRAIADTQVDLPAHEVSYSAVLTSEPVVHGRVVQTDLLLMDGANGLKVKASILRDTLDNRWKRLQVGMGIKARSLLVVPSNYCNSSFDYARWLRCHGYKAQTFIYFNQWKEAEVDLSSLSSVQRTILLAKRFRHYLLERLQLAGLDGPAYAVIAAMVLGEKSQLLPSVQDDYSLAGASHILALSGLHLGIIYTLLSFLMMGWRKQWLSQVVILSFVWGYVVMVGMSPSVMRSAIMLTVCSIATLLQRNSVSINTLSLAGVLLLTTNPMTLYDISFQLSFASVFSILLFSRLFLGTKFMAFLFAHRWLRAVCGLASTSVAAQIGTAPLVIFYFGRFSCYFLLSNFIAIPCATFLLYGTVVLLLLSPVQPVETLLSHILSDVAGFQNAALAHIAALPGSSIGQLHWSVGQVLAVYVVLACLYFLHQFFVRHEIIS